MGPNPLKLKKRAEKARKVSSKANSAVKNAGSEDLSNLQRILTGLPFKIERFDRKLISARDLRKRRNNVLKLIVIDDTEVVWKNQENKIDLGNLSIPPNELELLDDNDLRKYYKHPKFSPLTRNVHTAKANLPEDLTNPLDLFKLFFPHDQVKVFVKVTNAYVKSMSERRSMPSFLLRSQHFYWKSITLKEITLSSSYVDLHWGPL
jgi:hypothetical protein